MSYKKTTKEFISESIKNRKLLASTKYINPVSYSKTNYINVKTKVLLTCLDCNNDYLQSPQSHTKGIGCPHCSGNKKKDLNYIKREINKLYGSQIKLKDNQFYTNIDIELKFECKYHGEFLKKPYDIINRKRGCIKCSQIRNYSNEEKIDLLKKKYINNKHKLDYSISDFSDPNKETKIICLKHGPFKKTFNKHFHSKQGCLECSMEEKIKKSLKTTSSFISESINLYGKNRFFYPNIDKELKGLKSSLITIICSKCNFRYSQKAANHIRNNGAGGCPNCTTGGYRKDLPGILYYVKIEKEGLIAYKIGVTNKSVSERFGSDMKYITVLSEIYYEYGEECLEAEQFILKEFVYAKWTGPNILSSGNTELFKTDILMLDNNQFF